MAVIDGEKVNAAVTNSRFISRTVDSNTVGVVDLDNTTDANSGAQVPNAQEAINENYDVSGTFYQDANAKVYATNNVIADGDNQKEAIEKIDVQVQTNIDDINDRIVGPATATDNAVVRYDLGTGKLAQDSGVIIDDSDNVTGINDLTMGGTLTVATVNTVSSTVTEIADPNITLNNGGNDASSEGSGVTVERTGTDGSIIYADAAASKFKVGAVGSEVEVADISTAQTITNKTIDGNNNTLSNLAHGSEVDNPSSGVHGVTGSVVGTTDAQTLTNKILTSPELNGPAMEQDFGTATNTNFLNLPHDTTTNLNALTDVQGLIAYDDTLDQPVYNDGVSWQTIGSGSATTEAARYTTSSAPSVPNNDNTFIVKFVTLDYDTLSNYNTTTGLYTFSQAGTYHISTTCILDNGGGWASGEQILLRFYKNGSTIVSEREIRANASHSTTFSNTLNDTLEFAVSDTVEIRLFQNSGAALALTAVAESNFFSIFRI